MQTDRQTDRRGGDFTRGVRTVRAREELHIALSKVGESQTKEERKLVLT